jgi:hypothetical protein
MRLLTTHEKAKSAHPVEYASLLAQYNRSKTKTAKANTFESMTIEYDWCEYVEGCSFLDMLSGKVAQEPKTWDDRLVIIRANVKVNLHVYKGSLWLNISFDEVPEEIIKNEKANWEKGQEELKRIKSLSPTQWDDELGEALKKLAGPGFVGVFGQGPSKMETLARKAGVKIIKPKSA